MTQSEDDQMAEQEPQSNLSPEMKGILERSGAELPPDQTPQGDVGEQTDSKQLTVTIDGVERTVGVEELVAAFGERDKTMQARKVLDERLAELGDLNAIRKLETQIHGLDVNTRSKVLAMLEGQSIDEDEGDLDESLEEAAFGRRKNGKADAQGSPLNGISADRFRKVEQAVMALAARENGRISGERTASLSDQVKQQMDQYPLFRRDATAASFASDSIMNQLAVDPEADVEKVVRTAAGKLQKLTDDTRQRANERVGAPRTMVQPEDAKGLTAKGLKDGSVRKLVERIVRGA